jgi:hypothetical protein
MQQTKTLLAASIILSLTTLTAEASLTASIAGGQSVVYSSVSDITWTGDANLLGTMIQNQGYSTVVNAIIAASPTINDTPNIFDKPSNSGHYSVTSTDFNSTHLGQVTWFGAQAFTSYLNSLNYAGSQQWTLPSAGTNPQRGYNQTSTQFGELFYNELGGTANHAIPINSKFTNQQQGSAYWLGTEYAPYPFDAWVFYSSNYTIDGVPSSNGAQSSSDKNWTQWYAWAVSPGKVAAVPVPAAVWLFGSGLIGLTGLKRRSNIG